MLHKAVFALLAGSSVASVILDRDSRENSAKACAELKATFPNGYVDSSSANYTAEQNINWSTNCRLPATCFFLPSNTAEVAKGLSIVTKARSQFSVRNGGHNPNVKFGSITHGVLFDTSRINAVSLSADNKILHTGSGNRGGIIQSTADSVGRSGTTGIDSDPGITGLILGGGYTHFSQLSGLPNDNVVNFEVVLGNSSVVNANATHNTDLYRALRGGGNNFGIVTRLDLLTSPIHDIWFTLYTIDPKEYRKVMPAISKIQQSMESDPKANIEVLASAKEFQIALVYAEPAPAKPEIFAPLLDIPPGFVVAPPTNGTVLELMTGMSNPKDPLVRMVDSVIYKPNTDFLIALYEKVLKEAPTSGNQTDLVIAIKPIGSTVGAVGTKVAGGIPNSLNLPAIPQIWGSSLAVYQDEVDRETMTEKLKELNRWTVSNARKQGLLLPNLFVNDAGGSQNVMASYGQESLANLKAVSKKYDSAQVFQKLQAGGWKVSEA